MEELRRTAGVLTAARCNKKCAHRGDPGRQQDRTTDPLGSPPRLWGRSHVPRLVVMSPVGGRGGGGALSRVPVAAPGVSCSSVQRLPEKQKRWAGRRRGENGWREGGVPRTLPRHPPMVEQGLARGGTSRLEARPRIPGPFRVPRAGPPGFPLFHPRPWL